MSKAESADLILKLYELRREPTMREARNWILSFFPESAADIMQADDQPGNVGVLSNGHELLGYDGFARQSRSD